MCEGALVCSSAVLTYRSHRATGHKVCSIVSTKQAALWATAKTVKEWGCGGKAACMEKRNKRHGGVERKLQSIKQNKSRVEGQVKTNGEHAELSRRRVGLQNLHWTLRTEGKRAASPTCFYK